jgi:hypothetical protein
LETTSGTVYDLFLKIIDKYTPAGFRGIDRNDPLILEAEEMMETNDQFFFIGDMINVSILFTSRRSTQMFGITPEETTPGVFMNLIHPDDKERHSMIRSRLFQLAHEIFVAGKGSVLYTTCLKIRHPLGKYSNIFSQSYLFYSEIPYKTVFVFEPHTCIDWFKHGKNWNHYYLGSDMSNFRYPDRELLKTGIPFTRREFEIIRLVMSGLSSNEIAEKLYLSLYTVNTHRRNILKKTGKIHLADVILDLKNYGLI